MAPDRIDTIVEWSAAAEHGVKIEGNSAGASAEVLAELARLVADGELEVPIASVYPLDRVKDAYRALETVMSTERSSWSPEAPAGMEGPYFSGCSARACP